jgi:hypothetical protein
MEKVMTLKQRLEHEIAVWDRGNKNHHAGAIALLRLDEVLAEYDAGRPLIEAITDGFDDRLRDRLLKAIELIAVYKGE